MSPGDAETVKRLFERWNAGEHSIPPEDLDPAVTLESPLSSLRGEPYHGHAGVEQWLNDLDEHFTEWEVRLDEVREVGNAVIAIGGVHLQGRASGAAFDQSTAWVVEFGTDHRITRARIYTDVEAALEAVRQPPE